MTLLGFGSEIYKVKVENPKFRKFFVFVGVPTLVIGLTLSILLVVKEVFDTPIKIPSLDNFAWLFAPNLLIVYLSVLASVAIIYFVYGVITEKMYDVDGVLVNSSEHRANIRVDHKGGKSFLCIAKLEEVIRISRSGDRDTLKLDELNPDGKVFEWVDKNWNNKIVKDYPRVVRIVGINEWQNYKSNETHLIFYGSTSPNLDPRYSYEITVGIYRLKGWRHIKMKSVKGTLKINSEGLSWNAAEQSVHPTSGIRRNL